MEKLLMLVGAIVALILTAVILTLPTLWLWNWLMPILFSLPKITFWQAIGINLLSGILFKSYSLK